METRIEPKFSSTYGIEVKKDPEAHVLTSYRNARVRNQFPKPHGRKMFLGIRSILHFDYFPGIGFGDSGRP